jgi:hypothetical protein
MQFLLASVALAGARNLTAAVVICPTMTDIGTLLSFNSVANACYSQDSMFWNFTYAPGPKTIIRSNGAEVAPTNGSPGPLPGNGKIGLGAGTSGPKGGITQRSLRFYETEPLRTRWSQFRNRQLPA